MIKLKEYQFSELMIGFFDGPHATPAPSDSGPVFLGIKNIKSEGGIDLSQIRHISENEYPKWTKRVVPSKNDLVFSYEATLHRYALIQEGFIGCLGRRMALIRTDKEKLDPEYLYYYFLSSYWRAFVETIKISGSTVDRISIIDFPKFKISIPNLPIQKKIASILSAYDDLIENNNQRIKLLEEMASDIYKEWFVRFRFPNYQNTKILDKDGNEVPHGTKGAIPEGWDKIRIKDILETIEKGPSLKYDIDENDGDPVLNQSCVRNGLIELQKILIAKKLPKNKQHCYLRKNDILINSMGDGTLGRVSKNVQLESNNYIIHNCITFLRSKESFSQFLLFHIVKQNIPYFLAVAQGSTGQSTLKKELISNIKTIKPSEVLLKKFDILIDPMWNEIGTLSNKNKILQETRDLLLPRLISGKLSLDSLEKVEINMAAEAGVEYK